MISAMSIAILFAAVAFIFVFVLALHIPLPPQICDRQKIQIFEFLIRLSNEYVVSCINNYLPSPRDLENYCNDLQRKNTFSILPQKNLELCVFLKTTFKPKLILDFVLPRKDFFRN